MPGSSSKPLIWTYLIEGLGVEWKSLPKIQLFMYEAVKRLGVKERGRVSFILERKGSDEYACTVMCGIAQSEIYIATYPEHRYTRMMITTIIEPEVKILGEIFMDFFKPDVQTEGFLESPER